MRYWTPEDIFDVQCPFCGEEIEFWKDEPARLCRTCGNEVRNPRINLGCAKWCKSAKECLGEIPEAHIAAAPIIEALRARLNGYLGDQPEKQEAGEAIHTLADTLLAGTGGDPCIIKAGALLSVIEQSDRQDEIIQAIGLENDRETRLKHCLQALRTDTVPPDEHLEYDVIHDAIAIWQFAESAHPGDLEILLASLQTPGARALARRRLKSNSA